MTKTIRLDGIRISRTRLVNFCRTNHIRKLSFFGSVLRKDFRKRSDINVLVEFEPRHIPGLMGFVHMENELAELFGRKVDLNTPASLSPYFREEVLGQARVEYDSAQ